MFHTRVRLKLKLRSSPPYETSLPTISWICPGILLPIIKMVTENKRSSCASVMVEGESNYVYIIGSRSGCQYRQGNDDRFQHDDRPRSILTPRAACYLQPAGFSTRKRLTCDQASLYFSRREGTFPPRKKRDAWSQVRKRFSRRHMLRLASSLCTAAPPLKRNPSERFSKSWSCTSRGEEQLYTG